MRKVQYFTDEEKQALIDNAVFINETLTEEANLTNGNFLTFCILDEIPTAVIPMPTAEERLTAMEGVIMMLLIPPM